MTMMKKIHVCALGGTIAMAKAESSGAVALAGVQPVLTGSDLVNNLPSLNIAEITTSTLTKVGSPNLTFKIAENVVQQAEKACDKGVDGFVVTQGTDTMEEMAFLLSLLWNRACPLVVTGAMRHSGQENPDGGRNLESAIRLACSDIASGVYVVMHGEIHDPLRVRKAHTSKLEAFKSDGPLVGTMKDDQLSLNTPLLCHDMSFNIKDLGSLAKVGILYPQFDDCAWQLEAVSTMRFDGLVVAALGGGHVNEYWADILRVLALKMPIILTSRIGEGPTLTNTYGYKGAEIDLLDAGLVSGGSLPPNKARILLKLLLASKDHSVADTFAYFSKIMA